MRGSSMRVLSSGASAGARLVRHPRQSPFLHPAAGMPRARWEWL